MLSVLAVETDDCGKPAPLSSDVLSGYVEEAGGYVAEAGSYYTGVNDLIAPKVTTNLKQQVEQLRQLAVCIKPGSLATLAFIPPPTLSMTEFSKYKFTHILGVTKWDSLSMLMDGAGADTNVSVI